MRGVIVGLVLAAAVAIGLATFPQAFEPGRAEANGPELTLLAGGRVDGTTWTGGRPGRLVTPTADGVAIRAEQPGTVLISRTLAVFPEECYALSVDGRSQRAGLELVVSDERAEIDALALPIRAGERPSTVATEFVPGRRRITLVVRASRPVVGEIASIGLARAASPC